MLGLFKKKVTSTEVGSTLLGYVFEFLSTDAGRSLGSRFQNIDATHGWSKLLESRGIPLDIQKLYFRLYLHCSIQAACTQFEEGVRRGITHGATVQGFKSGLGGYDFDKCFSTLETAYSGRHKFHPALQNLANSEAYVHVVPNPEVGVINSKFLIEEFVLRHLTNGATFVSDFHDFSSTQSSSVATTCRAVGQILSLVKITS